MWTKFDADALKDSASLFLGKHDFSAFGSKTSADGTAIRTITKCQWKKKPDGEYQLEVTADAFLYHMVRRMVFIQISLAQGKCSLKDVEQALSKKLVKLPSGLAPAHGLTLIEVKFNCSNDLSRYYQRSDERATKNILSESR